MANLPTVTIAPAPDAESHLVRVTLGDRIRHFETSAGRVKNRLVAVLISEFGMLQDDAHAHAEAEIAAQQTRQDVESIRAEKVADYDRLAAELGAAQKRVAELEALYAVHDQDSGDAAVGPSVMADPVLAPLVQSGVSAWIGRRGRHGELGPAAEVLVAFGEIIDQAASLSDQAEKLTAENAQLHQQIEQLTAPPAGTGAGEGVGQSGS